MTRAAAGLPRRSAVVLRCYCWLAQFRRQLIQARLIKADQRTEHLSGFVQQEERGNRLRIIGVRELELVIHLHGKNDIELPDKFTGGSLVVLRDSKQLNRRFRKGIEIGEGKLASRTVGLKKYQERAFSRFAYQACGGGLTLLDHV